MLDYKLQLHGVRLTAATFRGKQLEGLLDLAVFNCS